MPPVVEFAREAWEPFADAPGVLLSYWATRTADVAALAAPFRALGCPIFGDSGAFSALGQAQTIDVEDYRAWLLRWRDEFHTYANLDVIGNLDASTVNQRLLEDAGLTPLPVFHAGEPWAALDAMADEYDHLALGGLVSFRRGASMGAWIADAYRLINGRAEAHGFGVTRWQFMRDFPWDSVDSTTWLSGHRYGAQLIWNGSRLVQQTATDMRKHEQALVTQMKVTVTQAESACLGDRRYASMIGLRACALAQRAKRLHTPAFTIYCSGDG